jgi:hypothetical protein
MHPEITREMVRAQREELARRSRRASVQDAAALSAASTHRAGRRLRWALRHASQLTHGAH